MDYGYLRTQKSNSDSPSGANNALTACLRRRHLVLAEYRVRSAYERTVVMSMLHAIVVAPPTVARRTFACRTLRDVESASNNSNVCPCDCFGTLLG